MAQDKRFCTNCGSPLGTGDKFCGGCGQQASPTALPAEQAPDNSTRISPVQATPTPAAAAPALPPLPPAETLVGIIPSASRKKSLLAVEGFNILVTDKRMIFAIVTNEMIMAEAKSKKNEGFMSNLLNTMTIGYTFHERYLTMDPEVALKENPQNFFLNLKQISRVKLELGKSYHNKVRNVDSYEDGKLEFECGGQKYSFKISSHFHNQAWKTLCQAGLVS